MGMPNLKQVLWGLGAAVLFFTTIGQRAALDAQPSVVDSGKNVIFITWDGVRLEEWQGQINPALFAPDTPPPDAQKALMPFLWQELAPKGRMYGDTRQGEYMTVANLALISLPGYESIFAGSTQMCDNNDGPRVAQSTFPERLVHEMGLRREDVAAFASWENLGLAFEAHPGTTTVNAGLRPFHDLADAAEDELNGRQQADKPDWDDCRYDRYTWQHAVTYLGHHRPRFLYISLDDSDAWGHRVEYGKYLTAIRTYDQWLRQLVEQLKTMGDYGRNTCLIVTSDHGRGSGTRWSTHSNGVPLSGRMMMYAGCPLDPGATPFLPPSTLTTHLDIRPTIEALFGLKPKDCLMCGSSLVPPAH